MPLNTSLSVGVSGVLSQSNKLAVISDNISNINTVGYKRVEANFANLVAFDNNSAIYSPGGVLTGDRLIVATAGLLRPTDKTTDLAVSGDGMFVVSDSPSNNQDLLYTRAGAFDEDDQGNLVNTAGYFLKGWRLDEQGNLPAALNQSQVNAGTAFSNLQTVNVNALTINPIPTSVVSVKANLQASQTPFDFTPPSTYDPADIAANMASGGVAPHFTTPLQVIDSTGESHQFTIGYLKTAVNTWAIEIYANDATEINPTGTQLEGQIAAGTVTFNGDGTLNSVSAGLTGAITVNWTNTAVNNSITFDLGTAGPIFGTPNAVLVGRADGLYQLDTGYLIDFVDQNGQTAGSLVDIEVDGEGYVFGKYSNQTIRRVFKIPLAKFLDPGQLTARTGNVFALSENTPSPTFYGTGQQNIGRIFGGTLEDSNVDLSAQLVEMVIAQQAYQANTRIISTSDEMLQRLDQTVR